MLKKLIAACFLAVLVISAAAPAFALGEGDLPAALAGEVEGLTEPGGAKGAVLSVVAGGEVLLCKGYGYADEANGFSADGEKTAFRIGSVSKTFVAVAALALFDRGVLDLDRDVSAYLEADFPALARPVTMRQLLTHTAGFEDRVTGMAVWNVSDTEPLSLSVRKHMPAQVFMPGETVSYSNYGIALAAYVVECLAGMEFSQFCRDAIFLPLGMNRTTFEHMHDVAYVSKPYLACGAETLEPYMNLYPEGSAVSTAGDMAAYMLWLLDREDARVLSPRAKEELFARQFAMSEDLMGMGCVWNRKSRNGAVYYDKKGETLHFYTRIALYPEKGTGVFLSFNTYLPEHEIDAVLARATDMLYGVERREATGMEETVLDIRGRYVNNWSSFRTPEKLLRYIVPGKMLAVEGSKEKGFTVNGESMIPVGCDLYASPMGVLKFLQRDGSVVMATESAVSYARVPFWQSRDAQAMPPLLFAVAVLVCIGWELVPRLRGRRVERGAAFLLCSTVQLLSFGALCILACRGVASFSLLSLAMPMRLCGWVIAAAVAAGIAATACDWAKRSKPRPVPVAWSLTGILFCAWMAFHSLL